MQLRSLSFLAAVVWLGCGGGAPAATESTTPAPEAGADARGTGGLFDAGPGPGCGTTDAAVGAMGAVCPADGGPPPSFARDVAPIFASCAGEVCHGDAFAKAEVERSLVGVPATECCDGRALVAPFDPAHSYLIQKLRGDVCGGDRMPLGRPAPPEDEIRTLVAWVCAGAPLD